MLLHFKKWVVGQIFGQADESIWSRHVTSIALLINKTVIL